jgi:hypothetical protein
MKYHLPSWLYYFLVDVVAEAEGFLRLLAMLRALASGFLKYPAVCFGEKHHTPDCFSELGCCCWCRVLLGVLGCHYRIGMWELMQYGQPMEYHK